MTTHRHHSTPRHLGGIGPIQLLEDRDHSYVHFHRFVNGEDKWFHSGLLKFLDPWDQITIREVMSERVSGEGNPMYGVEPTVKGWFWWTDGITDRMSPESPGLTWRRGRSQVDRSDRTYRSGHSIFTNGITEVHGHDCPEGFWKGRLPVSPRTKQKMSEGQIGLLWWNNGEEEVQSRTQPDGFVKGRLIKKSKQWSPISVYDTVTQETTVFESMTKCYSHFGVTKKVLERRLKTRKLLLGQFYVQRVK